MNPHVHNFEDIQDRLQKLEKQNRRIKQLGAVALVFAAVIVIMGQAPTKKTVEANEFVLRDDNGNIRARLFVTPKSTATAREVLGIDSSAPVTVPSEATLALYDEKAKTRGFFNENDLAFYDSDGKSDAILGSSMVSVGDKESGAVMVPGAISTFADGFSATLGKENLITPRTGETQMRSAASLVMFDRNKNVIWKAP